MKHRQPQTRKPCSAIIMLACVSFGCVVLPVAAQSARHTPYLVADIVTQPSNESSQATIVGGLNGVVFFIGTHAEHGRSIWAHDGSDTQLLSPSLQNVREACPLGENLVIADDELWVTDGSPGNTVQLVDLNPTGNSRPTHLTRSADQLFFFAGMGSGARLTLAKTDGTAAGTAVLAVVHPQGYLSSAPELMPFAGGVVFVADDGQTGTEPWASDGTPEGTQRLVDLNPGPSNSWVDLLLEFEGEFYFSDSRSDTLWKTDGTIQGTVLVFEGVDVSDAFVLNDDLFFWSRREVTETWVDEMWRTDGAPGHEVLISDQTALGYDPVVYQGEIFFRGVDDALGAELWKTDGTEAGTVPVKDIRPGPDASLNYYPRFMEVDGFLYFFADDGVYGLELWKTQGTEATTQMVIDLAPGPVSTAFGESCVFQNALLFSARGDQLFQTDGSETGTTLIKDMNPYLSSAPILDLQVIDDALWWSGEDLEHGREPWTYDGVNTIQVADLDLYYAPSSNIESLTAAGDTLFFQADNPDSAHPRQIYKTRGLESNTLPVVEVSDYIRPPNMAWVNGRLLFANRSLDEGAELWVSDGTPEGTQLLLEFFEGEDGGFPSAFHVSGDRVFFKVYGTGGYSYFNEELWVSDGTLEGTQGRISFRQWFSPDFGNAGDLTYFVNRSSYEDDDEFWATDGISGRTQLLASFVNDFGAFGDQMAFSAFASGMGYELMLTDGTVEGTRQVADIIPGEESSDPRQFVTFQDALFFNVGAELWTSDGTEAGTLWVADIGDPIDWIFNLDDQCLVFRAGDLLWRSQGTSLDTFPIGSAMEMTSPVMFDGRVYANGYDPDHGWELWRTDGTHDGTFRIADLWPGTVSSSPTRFCPVGAQLYFTADTPEHGRELWRICGEPDIQIQAPASACANASDLTASLWCQDASASIDWDITQGTITAGQGTPQITFQAGTTGPVVLAANVEVLGGCHNSAQVQMEIHDGPPPQPNGISGPNTFCPFETNVVYGLTNPPEADGFSWQVPPDAVISAGQGSAQITVDFGQDLGVVSVVAFNGCGASAAQTLTVTPTVTWQDADAGPDQEVCGTQTVLNAGPPDPGVQGTWTLVSGFSGSFSEPHNPSTIFSGLEGETYQLQWSLDHSPCGVSNDVVYVSFSLPATHVNAGPDQAVCHYYATLEAEFPDRGVGHWELIEPVVADPFTNIYNPNTRFQAPTNQDYLLHWVVESGVCDPQHDEVIIALFDRPAGTAGPSHILADGEVADLAGENPLNVFGEWHVSSGPSTDSLQFSDVHDPQALFFPQGGHGMYRLEWSMDNGVCPPNTFQTCVSIDEAWRTPRVLLDSDLRPIEGARSMLRFNEKVFFVRMGHELGEELWSTDGSPQSTQLIMDINTQAGSGGVGTQSADVQLLTEANDLLFFTADTPSLGRELWVTDGTAEGTRLVMDVNPGLHDGTPTQLVALDNVLLFSATDDSIVGRELWRSDGTPQGTFVVMDIYPGGGDSVPRELTSAPGVVLFVADTEDFQKELWRTDGTQAGTWQVTHIHPSSSGPYIEDLTCVGNRVFFTAISADEARELWIYDVVTDQANLVADLSPGTRATTFDFFHALDDALIFAARRYGESSFHLWISDGTEAGTTMVPGDQVVEDGAGSFVEQGALFFYGRDGGTGVDGLYRSDGTQAGTLMLSPDVKPGSDRIVVNGRLFFAAAFGYPFYDYQLAVTDGTSEGTEMVRELGEWPDYSGGYPRELLGFGDTLLFCARDHDGEYRLFRLFPDAQPGPSVMAPTSVCGLLGPHEAVLAGAGPGEPVQWQITHGEILGGQDEPLVSFRADNGPFVTLIATVGEDPVQHVGATISVLPMPVELWNTDPATATWRELMDIRDLIAWMSSCP